MKKELLLFTFLFTCYCTAYSQKVYIGIKGGINSSTLTGSDTTFDKKQLLGFHAGVVANIGVSDALSLQPELTYSQQGIDGRYLSGPFKDIYFKAYLNYINTALLVKALFGGESIRFFVNAGPYAGYMLSGKNVFYDDLKNKIEVKYDFVTKDKGDDIKRLDIGVLAGIGVTFRAGPGDILVDLRYNLGFITVSEKPPFKKYTNSVYNVSLGYVIPLGDFY